MIHTCSRAARRVLLGGLLLATFGGPNLAQARFADDPTALVRDIISDTLATLRQLPDDDPGEPVEERATLVVDSLVSPHMDFRAIAERLLGEHWHAANGADQAAFLTHYRQYLATTYSRLLLDHADVEVDFKQAKRSPDGRTARVTSMVDAAFVPFRLRIDYYLRTGERGWRLLDVTFQGISLTKVHAASFIDLLSEGGMTSLIAALEARGAGPTDL